MPELPTGTITFLFTDVEGSTRLWEEHPQAMRLVMARHDALLTVVFAQHDGVVVRPRGEGDSLFAVFVRASDAVTAALAGQRALASDDWGETGPLRVRMGLHTGEADLREGDYYGSAVNRCARIRAAGHGGQILLSEATARLVREALPVGAGLRELGHHHLRDLSEPELIFQLDAAGSPNAFPPLKTLDARPHNLPVQLTSFIGREPELGEITMLLGQHRLVTLTGPGGTGKTRLALQVGAALLDGFPDGVFFVDLAPLADPALVPSAVAQALGVGGRPDVPIRDSLLRFLLDKHLLLVLDNYEHLLAAAEFAEALLQAAQRVSLLATSRAPLRLRGEREYPVAPLPVPENGRTAPGVAAQSAAVALFVDRARAVQPGFGLTDANAGAVAAICARLDGLPLAIELASARLRVLPPAALLARLERRLPLLTGGARMAPQRQQTLRDAIAWSYALLDPAEQRFFRRLSVFAGGCTLELAEAVCNADGELGLDVLDGVSSLVEKSLLRQGDDLAGEPRYRMLETIREFALGELEASGEGEAVRRLLAVPMLQLARQCAAPNTWPRLDADVDNARAVLGWCVDRAELAIGVRMFSALGFYLMGRGGGKEYEAWRQRLLALPEAAQPSISRARLLALSPIDVVSTAERDRALAELEEAAGLSRQLDDIPGLVRALENGVMLRMVQGQMDSMVPLGEEALALRLRLGAVREAVTVRGYLLTAAIARGDLATAAALVAANRALPASAGMSMALKSEAELAEAHGDDAQARRLLEDSVRVAVTEHGEISAGRLVGLTLLARVMLRQGDTGAAVATCAACLDTLRRGGPSRFLARTLNVLALAAERCGLLVESARLLATVEVERRESAAEVVGLAAAQEAAVERVRAVLDVAAFAEAWAAGEALSSDEAITFGLTVAAELERELAPAAEHTIQERVIPS